LTATNETYVEFNQFRKYIFWKRKGTLKFRFQLTLLRAWLASLPTIHSAAANHYSLLTIHYSLFTIHYSLFTIHYSLFTTHYSLLTIHYSLFTTHYSLLTIHYSLLTIHYSLLTTHYSLLFYFPLQPTEFRVRNQCFSEFVVQNFEAF
jgi:hypothetical protein